MELKQLNVKIESTFIFLLIVPYGIETFDAFSASVSILAPFNRTLWN